MKAKKQDGKGQGVPTHQTKTEPEKMDAYEEQIRESGRRAMAMFLRKIKK